MDSHSIRPEGPHYQNQKVFTVLFSKEFLHMTASVKDPPYPARQIRLSIFFEGDRYFLLTENCERVQKRRKRAEKYRKYRKRRKRAEKNRKYRKVIKKIGTCSKKTKKS